MEEGRGRLLRQRAIAGEDDQGRTAAGLLRADPVGDRQPCRIPIGLAALARTGDAAAIRCRRTPASRLGASSARAPGYDVVGRGAGGARPRRFGTESRTSAAAQIDAKRRFEHAIESAGPGLSDILWRVVCAGEGMREAESALGWPARAGKLVLTFALDRVADYYRIR